MTQLDLNDFLTHEGIDEGKLIRYWRQEVLKWEHTSIIVGLFNEVVGADEKINKRWWQRMEKNNKVPIDHRRRRIIQTLLNIPSAYIGLSTPTVALPLIEIPNQIPLKTEPIELKAYKTNLKTLWASPYEKNSNLFQQIYQLQDTLLYGKESKDKVATLLCEYLVLAGNIERANGNYDAALPYLDRATLLAHEREFQVLEAKSRYMRGYTLFEKWHEQDKRENRANLQRAAVDCGSAAHMLKQSNTTLAAAVHNLYAEVNATNEKNTREVVSSLKLADTTLSVANDDDPFFFEIDADWCQIGKAQTFIALGWSTSALTELTSIQMKKPVKKRRYLTAQIAESEAYLVSGKIDMGLAYANDALTIACKLQAHSHIAHLATLYDGLRRDDKYARNPDVVRLGLRILQAQYPELFY